EPLTGLRFGLIRPIEKQEGLARVDLGGRSEGGRQLHGAAKVLQRLDPRSPVLPSQQQSDTKVVMRFAAQGAQGERPAQRADRGGGLVLVQEGYPKTALRRRIIGEPLRPGRKQRHGVSPYSNFDVRRQ